MSGSTKGRRGRKTAGAEQEHVIDTTAVPNGNSLAPPSLLTSSVATVKGRKSKRAASQPPVAATAPIENGEATPAKRGRSKAKENPAEPVLPESKPKEAANKKATTAPKATSRGKRNAPKETESEVDVKEIEKKPPPARGRGKAATVKVTPEPKPDKQEASRASKRVTKKEPAKTNGLDEEVAPKKKAAPRGRKPSADKEVEKKSEEKPKTARSAKAKSETASSKKAGKAKATAAESSRKRAAPPPSAALDSIYEEDEANADEFIIAAKKPKAAPKKAAAAGGKQNATVTDYSGLDFGTDKEFNLKISSWNIAGLRAWIKKGGLEYIDYEKPDIICLQETKCVPDAIPDEAKLSGYHPYWLCKPGGHAGVAIYSKIMPINIEYGLGDKEQDEDGRILTAEYEKFFLICVYVPNAGRGLVTLSKRLRWNKLFENYVQRLNGKKPVIICGDMNVAHHEIDLANPKTNKKTAGFTPEERAGMTDLLNLGYVDTLRHLYPERERAFTFWAYFMNSRAKDVGWRLDYFLVSERLLSKCVDNLIRSKVLGSDHCPITLLLNL